MKTTMVKDPDFCLKKPIEQMRRTNTKRISSWEHDNDIVRKSLRQTKLAVNKEPDRKCEVRIYMHNPKHRIFL